MSATAPRPTHPLVREATQRDTPALIELFIELKEHHRQLQPSNPRYQADRRRWKGVVSEALGRDDTRVFVTEAAGQVAGLLKMSFEDKPWGLACEIDTLVVTASERGLGHGSSLMEEAERVAIEAGAKGLRVNVLTENDRARSFYERRGYKTFAVRLGKRL